MKTVAAIIVAAGEGSRFGQAKQFVPLRGKTVLDWSLEKFEAHQQVTAIILVVKDEAAARKYLDRFQKLKAVVKGGPKRQDSVRAGLARIDPEVTDVVLVHDGVRPLVTHQLISRIIEAAFQWQAAVPALPIEETVKAVDNEQVISTLDRSKLVRVQTPQGFFYSVLEEAFRRAKQEGYYATDEAALVERLGRKVAVVKGEWRNIKITTRQDLKIAEALIDV